MPLPPPPPPPAALQKDTVTIIALLEPVLCSPAHPILTLLTHFPEPHLMHHLLYRRRLWRHNLALVGLGVRAGPEVHKEGDRKCLCSERRGAWEDRSVLKEPKPVSKVGMICSSFGDSQCEGCRGQGGRELRYQMMARHHTPRDGPGRQCRS